MKKRNTSPAKRPGPKVAPVREDQAGGTALPILASAPALPADIERAPKRFYSINVRPDGKFFRLYDDEAPCGARLVKSDGFPLDATGVPCPKWEQPFWRYFDLEAATVAATMLQAYLDCHENPKLKAELNRRAKDADIPL